MNACVRCHRPIKAGEFYFYEHRNPVDVRDLLDYPDEPQGLLYQWKSFYPVHLDCPTEAS